MSDGPDHQLYAQAKSILQRVFEIPPAERGAYLESACGNHPELRAEVFSLLAAHEQVSGRFLDNPFTLQDGEVETGADPEDRDLTGQRVGAYRLERLLGRGGMGAVYLASRDDGEFKKHVAIKFIRSSAATPSLLRRFRAERQILADIDHPNIARLIDGGTADGMPFFIMEYVPGETLTQVLGQGPLPLARVMTMAVAVADVLEAVHAKGMVFRDLKPSNIMLTEQSGVKVLDFGIAKITRDESGEHSTALTESGWVVGSPRYMSPEQASGETVDARSDVFSFGVVIFEALIGRLPFAGDSRQEYFKNLITAPAEPLPVVMPEGLRAIVERCLRKSPVDRFASGKELAYATRELVARLDGRRSNSRTVWAALALLTVTLAAGLWITLRPDSVAGAVLNGPSQLVTTWAGNETNPRISPDLGWVSFIADRDGPLKIILRNRMSGEERTIEPRGGAVVNHEWSPSSDQIAYVARPGSQTIITTVPVGGGKPQAFVLPHSMVSLVRWIGTGIYYVSEFSLWRLDIVSTQVHEVTHWRKSMQLREADVTADESHIAFVAYPGKDPNATIWFSDINGTNPVQLTQTQMDPKFPRFRNARAREVVYVSEEGGVVDIWQVDVVSRKRHRLTATDTREGQLEVSSDGSLLLYEEVRAEAHLAWLDPNDKPPTVKGLTFDGLSDLLPAVSRTGNVLAFQRARTPDMSLGLQNATIQVSQLTPEMSTLRPITLTDGYAPVVSTDGRWVASAVRKAVGQYELWVVNVESKQRVRVTDTPVPLSYTQFPVERGSANVVWSPTETRLFFLGKDRAGAAQVFSASPHADGQGVDVQQVTTIDEAKAVIADVRMSADGSRLSYLLRSDVRGVSELRVRDLTRNKETLYLSEPAGSRLTGLGWTADGKGSVIIRDAAKTGMWDVVLLTSPLHEVEITRGLRDVTLGSFALDPTRRVVYFTRQRGNVHSVHGLSLDSHDERQLFKGEPYGKSLSAITVLENGRLLFAFQAQDKGIVANKYGR